MELSEKVWVDWTIIDKVDFLAKIDRVGKASRRVNISRWMHCHRALKLARFASTCD